MARPERETVQPQLTPLVAEKGRPQAPTEAFLPRFALEQLAVVMIIAQQSALIVARSSGSFPEAIAQQTPSHFNPEVRYRGVERWKYRRGSGRSRRGWCNSCRERHSFNSQCRGIQSFIITKSLSKSSGLY